MRTGGWPHPVTGHDWETLANQYRGAPPVVSPIAQIVESIISSGLSGELQFATSMWDLIVAPSPVAMPPLDVVFVQGAMGMEHVPADRIVVEHVPLVGIADVIERDASDAVPLFWAFMREKYGLTQGS